jgi:hypothetical protein
MSTNDTTGVTWGKTSWLALIAAVAQFAAALVIYFFAPDDQKAGAVAPLVTAASTLYALIKGRMDQAAAKALPPNTVVQPTPVVVSPPQEVVKDAVGEVKESGVFPDYGALGSDLDPVYVDEDTLDPAHEERDLHDGEDHEPGDQEGF